VLAAGSVLWLGITAYGAGVAANPATNRIRLPVDNGAWPNLIRLNLTGPDHVSIGDPLFKQ
jgi:hypothetical protein